MKPPTPTIYNSWAGRLLLLLDLSMNIGSLVSVSARYGHYASITLPKTTCFLSFFPPSSFHDKEGERESEWEVKENTFNHGRGVSNKLVIQLIFTHSNVP